MEPISRVVFNKWAQDSKWIQLNEAANVNGRQYTFLTPAGNLVIAMFDLTGNFVAVGKPMPPPASALPPFPK